MGRLGSVTCRVPAYGLAGIEGEKLAPPSQARVVGLPSSNVRRYRALPAKSLVVRLQCMGESHLVGTVVQPLQRVKTYHDSRVHGTDDLVKEYLD